MEENNFDKITPLPWRHGSKNFNDRIESANLEQIARVVSKDGDDYANAAYIVECCNNYPSLKADRDLYKMQVGALQENINNLAAEIKALRGLNSLLAMNLDRLIDRIKENGLQSNFPSAFERAVKAIELNNKL